MPKLKLIIGLFCFLTSNIIVAQIDRNIFINDLDSEEVDVSITDDNKRAAFYIYNQGFEKKSLRDSISKIESRQRKGIKYPSPKKKVYKGVSFIALNPPEKLNSLDDIVLISLEDYRKHQFKGTNSRNTYIIHPCKNGGFLKWKVTILPNK
ncbi:hypothetical protein CHU92_00135 [Flavobacterium cyanobacteriorum]|uniref:Uncharacterized protein n=1 Tax=Flavobacterium cyanobacteriorum TaxID=2022802 RepID=A0A256A9I4_9FLAO|nr:hypothetical protein [Flavobacterium cyanobacteriorum]OYQ50358.1 hypothetical protein CHU92_00135 [Flavobacterium cyanobacteriorum]